jgi:hypothetical protein
VWSQQGAKLVGTGAVGAAFQGASVALSADGNTAIVGGPIDNAFAGAAWIYTRSGGVWSQQGLKLVGTGAVGAAEQGESVALSADGNTATVGGLADNASAGAAWIYTRSGGVWTQQGSKLVGSGAVGAANQGQSVTLSADGNTAIVGGIADNSGVGAAWVYTRSGGVWTPQGSKLVGSGAVGAAQQGYSIALSSDGNTAIVGGYFDNGGPGAAWVYTRSGGVWSQQGSKLVGTGAVGAAQHGKAVALSSDANTVIVGGPNDNGAIGAVWVYTRSGGVWIQQGSKLVGTSAVGASRQGTSVALSGDGNTAIVGGYTDHGNIGAAWVFVQPPGNLQVSPATNIAASGNLGGPFSPASFTYSLSQSSGNAAYSISGVPSWLTASSTSGIVGNGGTTITFSVNASANALATGTYGPTIITFTNASGGLGTTTRTATLTVVDPAATHDFNGDGMSDILWRNSDGTVGLWLMNGTQFTPSSFGVLPLSWTIVGQRDFNGDGKGDILWRNADGTVGLWLMNGTQVVSTTSFGILPTSWTIVGTGDFNGDGKSDILWRNSDGTVGLWFMNGTQVVSTSSFGVLPTSWTIQGANAD